MTGALRSPDPASQQRANMSSQLQASSDVGCIPRTADGGVKPGMTPAPRLLPRPTTTVTKKFVDTNLVQALAAHSPAS